MESVADNSPSPHPAAKPRPHPHKPLARRPKITFKPIAQARAADSRRDDRRYVISATRLGQHVMAWAEPLWEGSFSITDIAGFSSIVPHLSGVGAYAQEVHVSIYTCDAIPFSESVWGQGQSFDGCDSDHPAGILAFSRLPMHRSGLSPRAMLEPLMSPTSRTHAAANEAGPASIVVSAYSEEINTWLAERHRLPFWQAQLALPPASSTPEPVCK